MDATCAAELSFPVFLSGRRSLWDCFWPMSLLGGNRSSHQGQGYDNKTTMFSDACDTMERGWGKKLLEPLFLNLFSSLFKGNFCFAWLMYTFISVMNMDRNQFTYMRYVRKQFYLIGMRHKNHFEDNLCKEWYLLLNIFTKYLLCAWHWSRYFSCFNKQNKDYRLPW